MKLLRQDELPWKHKPGTSPHPPVHHQLNLEYHHRIAGGNYGIVYALPDPPIKLTVFSTSIIA